MIRREDVIAYVLANPDSTSTDVAAVEHSRRSREVIDLWAWMKT